jgi:hypothetical protein
MDKQNRFFLSVTLSLFLGLVALRAITQRKPSSQMMEAMVAMACMIVAAILFYHVFTSRFFVREKATRSEPKQLSKFRYYALLLSVAAVFVAAGAGRFVVEYYNVEALFGSGEALWRKTHPLVLLLIGICCFLYAFYTILNEPEESDDRIKEKIHPITLLCYCMAAFLYAVALYAPNVRNNDTWHMTAALQSIYNVAFNTPFTMRTSGIYGHYAIFFWPFVKLFGHRPVAIAVMISVCGAVCEILFLYTLHQMIRSECIRRLAAFASIMPLMLLYRYAYFQVYPLRILPPMVVLAYAAWCERKKTEVGGNKQLLVGYILCALGIVWVTDVGLIATVAFSAWVLFGSLRQEGRFNRRIFCTCAYCLLGCVLAVAGMVLIINFYNVVICRAAPVLRACFFPFVGASGFSTGLQLNLVWKNISWIWVMVLFVVCTLIGLTATPLLKDVFHADAKWDMLFLCAVMGIGQSCYYFNRAAYFNLTIIAQEAVLCMAFLIERGGVYTEKRPQKCVAGPLHWVFAYRFCASFLFWLGRPLCSECNHSNRKGN